MESRLWILFVALAGLCWGTYVPLVAFGGKTLKSSYASFLCVGIAYFLIAILFPLFIFWYRGKFPQFNGLGVTFATLAGVAGALGALCVIFATFEFEGDRRFVAPVIFSVAPVINTIVSLFWHPEKSPFSFSLPAESPPATFYVGILLAGLGAGLVLYSKESSELKHAPAPRAAPPASDQPPT